VYIIISVNQHEDTIGHKEPQKPARGHTVGNCDHTFKETSKMLFFNTNMQSYDTANMSLEAESTVKRIYFLIINL
jgi:hypothetical protein